MATIKIKVERVENLKIYKELTPILKGIDSLFLKVDLNYSLLLQFFSTTLRFLQLVTKTKV